MSYLAKRASASKFGIITNLGEDFVANGGLVSLNTNYGHFAYQSTQTANNVSSISFDISPTLYKLVIGINKLVPITNGANLKIEFKDSSTGNYDTTAANYYYSQSSGSTNTNILPTACSNSLDMAANMIFTYSRKIVATGTYSVPSVIQWTSPTSGSLSYKRMSLVNDSIVNSISGIRFSFNSGNINTGDFALYYIE
ncbi:MAG: hypothetical protein K0S07_124 [Chlamydiales bacterium]|jgi:hypothetical protein|nr:hypothetical protein [Chlamydiales bacterium]